LLDDGYDTFDGDSTPDTGARPRRPLVAVGEEPFDVNGLSLREPLLSGRWTELPLLSGRMTLL